MSLIRKIGRILHLGNGKRNSGGQLACRRKTGSLPIWERLDGGCPPAFAGLDPPYAEGATTLTMALAS